MKRKRGGWKCLSLLLLCFLFLGITKMDARAEETSEVPQVTLTLNGNKEVTTTSSNVKLQLSIETRELKASDFNADCIYSGKANDYGNKVEYTKKPGKPMITGGKIIATVMDGEDSTKFAKSVTVKTGDVNYMKITASNGTIDWGTGSLLSYSSPKNFYVASGQYNTGVIAILTWNSKQYVVNFPVEIRCNDYVGKENAFGLYCFESNTNQNISLPTPEKIDFDGTTYTVTLSKRAGNDDWTKVNTVIPKYAYNASGVNAVELQNPIGGTTTSGFIADKPIAKLDETYSFKIKNSVNQEKEFKVVINMPEWYAYNMLDTAKYAPTLIVDDKSYSAEAGGTFGTVEVGKEVQMAIELKGDEAGKKLSGAIIRKGKGVFAGELVPCTVKENTIYFKVPKDDFTIWSVSTVESSAGEHKIETAVAVKESSENCSGVVQVLNESGATISTAYKDSKLTLKAIKLDNYRSIYDWEFDHWEAEDGLIASEDVKKPEVQITMPDKDVSVKAVYVRSGEQITVGTTQEKGAKIRLTSTNNGTTIISTNSFSDTYKTGITYDVELDSPSLDAYEFLGWKDENGKYYTETDSDEITWKNWYGGYKTPIFTLESGKPRTFIADFRAKKAGILTLTTNDDKQGTVSAKVGETDIASGKTVLYDGQTISLIAEAKKSYRFKEWKVTEPASDSGVTFVNETATTTTFVMPAKQALTVQAVFEPDPNYKSEECILSSVELLKSDGTLVKKAEKDEVDGVTTFIVQLTPKEMTKDEAGKLGTASTYKLRLTYSDKATAKIEGGYGDTEGDAKWSDGITNPISVGTTKTVTITAQNPDFHQDYNVKIVYDDKPFLTAGAVKRLSDTEATVNFTSSSDGVYYYAVVEKDATEPEINTNGSGVKVKANKAVTISLKSLTTGAKDIYIVVKDDEDVDNVKITDPPLKITIPAYDSKNTGYTIGYNQPTGGTISVDKTLAKEGELVTVTVTPDAGKKIKPDGLRYSQSGPPYAVVKIDTTTKQFKMPAYDITISCVFVDADTVTADGPTISAFIVNGVRGAINDTTGTITVTLPYGTDLTALKPAITLKGAVSVSPASGEKVDLSSPKTYTVTAEDGTTKTYTVTAYTEEQPKSEKLWESMLEQTGGSTDHTGKNTWWKKAKDMKKHNDYPKYW